MADPVKKSKVEAVESIVPELPQAPPMTAQEAEVRAVTQNQAHNFKAARTGVPTAVLPFGARIDATPYVKNRYRNRRMSDVLANPEMILTEEWKRDHQGWKYEWPVKGKLDTTAYVNSHRFTLVPFEAIDKSSPYAMVMASPEGHTVWMQHILVACSPEVHYEEKQVPVEEYLGRMSMNRKVVESDLNKNFGAHGYRASYDVTDKREER